MTDRLDEIRARLAKATPGPWVFDGEKILERRIDDDGFMEVICKLPSGRESDRNSELLTNAPADIDYLQTKLAEERAENQRLQMQVLELNQQIGELKFHISNKDSVLRSVESIISNSEGISGWHMNGEIATWGELGLDDEIAEALANEKTTC